MRTNHKLLDLFSGIGGFSLGAERNGIETIGFVEKDKFCQKVLKKHWSDVPIIDDIRKVNGKDFGSATIISGGFPCQPFSVAGKREGTDDDRYLWDEMLRVISSCKPTWVIGENVEGLINIQDGMVLRSVQDDLEREGFQVQCLVIPASGIGAWHQRNRVWIVAHSEHNGSYRQKGDATIKSSNQQKDRLSIRDDKNVSHTNNNGYKRGQSETRNKIDARENNKSIWRKSASNISGSSDDRGDKTKSSINEDISRSYNGNEEKPTTTERLCYLSEKSDKCDTINQTNSGQENNYRTLVQERQMFQLSKSRGLGDDQAAFERNKIRQGDDNIISHRVDTNNVSDSTSKGLENDVIQSNNKQTTNPKINSDRSFEKQQTWWQAQSELRGVPNGVSYELHSNRTDRIKALGNSIVPQIAEQIFRSIIDAE